MWSRCFYFLFYFQCAIVKKCPPWLSFLHPFEGGGAFHWVSRLKRSHYGLNSQSQKAKSVSAGYWKAGQLPMLKLFADYPLQLDITSLPIITHADCTSNPPDLPTFWQMWRVSNKSQRFLWSSLSRDHYLFLTWWVCFRLNFLHLSNSLPSLTLWRF